MADILMTQIPGTTHHYRALLDVDPADLTPRLNLFNFLDILGDLQETVPGIISDPFLEATIEAEFEAQSSSVTGCKFVADSLKKILSPSGHVIDASIQLDISTVAPIVEQGAIEMKFEFLHSGTR
jgi:hypothetical protein